MMRPTDFHALCERLCIVPWVEYDDSHGDPWIVGKAAYEVFRKSGINPRADATLILTAQLDDTVVGAVEALTVPQTNELGEFSGFSFDMAVLPEHQGGTIGYELMLAAIQHGLAESPGPVLCRNWCTNIVAARMLVRLFGFKETEQHARTDSKFSCTVEKWLRPQL